MTICRGCGHQMYKTASNCSQCGTEQTSAPPQSNPAFTLGGVSRTKHKRAIAVVALSAIGPQAVIGTQL